ncbi:MAG: hypothetical protein ACOCYQ_04010 [Alkalispirochaeta sp.]
MAVGKVSQVLGRTEGELRERFATERERCVAPYVSGETGFIPNVIPADALEIPVTELFEILRRRFGGALAVAIAPEATDPARTAAELPREVRSPASTERDTRWLTRTNMVGINVRTVGSFLGVLQYALTLPESHDSIHLLPIWEPGVVGSLYGMSSWKINGEFFSEPLEAFASHLDTPERQLKAVVNLLHLMGKKVGMDVIPHTDRFSEIVLAHPRYFEWLRREDLSIVDHREELHEEVQERIRGFLTAHGSAEGGALSTTRIATIFDRDTDEAERDRLLFGPPENRELRSRRRSAIARHLYLLGYEPVPATMAPPYRGLTVDPETVHVDADGHPWREYRITRPESMSRVFGPLTRYKLYRRKDDNRAWEIDFESPRDEVWRYVQERYGAMQRTFEFDFMRGDMSHVQMRPDGVPSETDEFYDILGSVGAAIRRDNNAPWFGYFAETFIAPPGVMGYGNELDHLDASAADVTLGDLQSVRVDDPEFIRRFRWYRDIATTRQVQPSFTVMTSDKDDPRFDEFYLTGNEARYFTALFLTDTPSYTGLNFECRDAHYTPAANENYTKLYVFQERSGPKATSGPFRFGRNGHLFHRISRIRLFGDEILPALQGRSVRWLLPPDATGGQFYLAWAYGSDSEPSGVSGAQGEATTGSRRGSEKAGRDAPSSGELHPICVVNFGRDAVRNLHIPLRRYPGPVVPGAVGTVRFSTDETRREGTFGHVDSGGRRLSIPEIAPGEALFLEIGG